MLRGFWNAVFLLCVILAAAPAASAAETGSILVETTGGTVALYRVGEINGQAFVLDEGYGGGLLTLEEILSPNLARWLLGQAKSGTIKAPDICGKALFSDLEPGLYLLSQRTAPPGSNPFAPILLPIPWDGEIWDVSIAPDEQYQMPITGDPHPCGSWILGIILSAMGLVICIHYGKRFT